MIPRLQPAIAFELEKQPVRTHGRLLNHDPETTVAVASPHLGSRVASSSDRWILRRLKAPSRPGICPSRTESSRFRLTNCRCAHTPRPSYNHPGFVSPMSLLLIRESAVLFYGRSPRPRGLGKCLRVSTGYHAWREDERRSRVCVRRASSKTQRTIRVPRLPVWVAS